MKFFNAFLKKKSVFFAVLLISQAAFSMQQKMKDLLHFARYNEKDSPSLIAQIEDLLEQDRSLNINQTDEYSCTLLHYACFNGDYELEQFLLEKGAPESVNILNKNGYTPLHISYCFESKANPKIVQLLLKYGAQESLNTPGKDGYTPLHLACKSYNLAKVKLLLDYGAQESLSTPDKYGWTPLHLACQDQDNLAMVKLLLDNGAQKSVNTPDKNGLTPLHFACRGKNFEMVRLLLDNDAQESLNTPDKDGQTPLHLVCDNRDNLAIVKLLLDNGAQESLNTPDKYGQTPLHDACQSYNLAMVKLLLDYGAQKSVNTFASGGYTPLYYACGSGNRKILRLLFENGAQKSVNAPNRSGDTSLCYACIKNDLAIIRLFLQNGATIKDKVLYSRKPEVLLHLKNAYVFQKSKNKLDFVMNKIRKYIQSQQDVQEKGEEEGEVSDKKVPAIPQQVIDIIRLAFCHSMLTFANWHTIEQTLFFKLMQKNIEAKNVICTALNIDERQYSRLSENFANLCKQIIKNIDLSFAKSKSFQNLLNSYAERKKMHAFTENDRKPFCEVEIECQFM